MSSAPNPYATPRAAVADEPASPGEYVPGGQAVPASRGWSWIADGWMLFKAAPGLWIGMIVVFCLMLFAAALVPLVGGLGISLLMPILVAGLMIACKAADQGYGLEFGQLFEGFKVNTGKLLVVGALSIAASFAMAFGVGIVLFALVFAAGVSPDAMLTPLVIVLVALVVAALSVPLAAALWFAPALVVLQNLDAIEAIKASFTGCLRNIGAFLVYGIAGLLLAIVATIPLGLGWLVLGPVLAISVYTAYRDIYLR